VTQDLNKVLAEKDAEIAALNHAGIKYLVRIDEQDLEIEMLRTRLEVDERHPYDGIYCRDETIRLQDAEISRLRSMIVVQEAITRWDEAEIEKLRAVLQRIRRWGSPMVKGYIDVALGRQAGGGDPLADDQVGEIRELEAQG
jgi:hypothetical protein